MSVELKPVGVIKARLGIQPNGRVQKFFTNTCYKAMDKYVPMDTGDLAGEVDIQTDRIIYEMNYAHYMYEGLVMGPNIPIKENGKIVGYFSPPKKHYTGKKIKYHQDKHEYAGHHWDRRMVNNEMDKVVKTVEDYIRRGK